MKNSKTEKFESIDSLPGSFVVNVGKNLERMTRGRLRSTVHRVKGQDFFSNYNEKVSL